MEEVVKNNTDQNSIPNPTPITLNYMLLHYVICKYIATSLALTPLGTPQLRSATMTYIA